MTRTTEPVRADFDRREPRCHICRDETVRVVVNELLDWQGVPIFLGRGKVHRITLAEILRDLAPLNEGRDNWRRITYDSLWVHFQRHYSLAGQVAYRRSRMAKEFRKFEEAADAQRQPGAPCSCSAPDRRSQSKSQIDPIRNADRNAALTVGRHPKVGFSRRTYRQVEGRSRDAGVWRRWDRQLGLPTGLSLWRPYRVDRRRHSHHLRRVRPAHRPTRPRVARARCAPRRPGGRIAGQQRCLPGDDVRHRQARRGLRADQLQAGPARGHLPAGRFRRRRVRVVRSPLPASPRRA